jgi:GNAT superfamily N-acetyltransferase
LHAAPIPATIPQGLSMSTTAPPSDLTLARATRADRAALLELLAAQLGEHDIALGDERLGRAIDGLLEDPDRGALLVAKRGGETVGVACLSWIWTLEHGGESAWLDELYVRPALRERGTGTALLHAAIAAARARGCLAVDLEVEAEHARAANLYAREGFRPHTRARWVLPLE